VLTLGLICVLQYMLHIYQLSAASLETEWCLREVEDLKGDLRHVQKDNTLSRLENSILREFVSQTEIEKALDFLIRRFVPAPEDGFGAYLLREEDRDGDPRFVVH